MPSRYLKESIKRSAQIDSLTCFEEVTFYRLLVTVDDYGRYYADPGILKSDLFPRKQNLTIKSIEDAIEALERKKLLTRYMVDDAPYLFLNTFQKHNKPRATASKFPDPTPVCKRSNTSADNCTQVYTSAYNRTQMSANAPVFDIRIRNSYSESENAPAHVRGELKTFGKFCNVLLSDEDHAALTELIPGADNYIERFSAKIAAKGYQYDNHYAALVSWYIEDKKDEPDSSFNVDDFWRAALNRSYGVVGGDVG